MCATSPGCWPVNKIMSSAEPDIRSMSSSARALASPTPAGGDDERRLRLKKYHATSTRKERHAKNGNFRNGDWTAEAIKERKWLRSLVRSFAKTGATE
jgi:hypothetical protein